MGDPSEEAADAAAAEVEEAPPPLAVSDSSSASGGESSASSASGEEEEEGGGGGGAAAASKSTQGRRKSSSSSRSGAAGSAASSPPSSSKKRVGSSRRSTSKLAASGSSSGGGASSSPRARSGSSSGSRHRKTGSSGGGSGSGSGDFGGSGGSLLSASAPASRLRGSPGRPPSRRVPTLVTTEGGGGGGGGGGDSADHLGPDDDDAGSVGSTGSRRSSSHRRKKRHSLLFASGSRHGGDHSDSDGGGSTGSPVPAAVSRVRQHRASSVDPSGAAVAARAVAAVGGRPRKGTDVDVLGGLDLALDDDGGGGSDAGTGASTPVGGGSTASPAMARYQPKGDYSSPEAIASIVRIQAIWRQKRTPTPARFQELAAVVARTIRRGNALRRLRQRRKLLVRRQFIARELLQTEKSYVAQLWSVIEDYLTPLRVSAADPKKKHKPLLTPAEINTLFGNVELIHAVNSALLTDIEKRLETWHTHQLVGDLFCGPKAAALRSYVAYVNNHSHAHALWKEQMAKSAAFKKMCQTTHEAAGPGGLQLEQLLITPVQRLPRYLLLLQDLYKSTWEDHADYEALGKAVSTVKELNALVDTRRGEVEDAEALLEMRESLCGPGATGVLAPSRRVARDHGTLRAWDATNGIWTPWRVIVFNDALLIAAPDASSSSSRSRRGSVSSAGSADSAMIAAASAKVEKGGTFKAGRDMLKALRHAHDHDEARKPNYRVVFRCLLPFMALHHGGRSHRGADGGSCDDDGMDFVPTVAPQFASGSSQKRAKAACIVISRSKRPFSAADAAAAAGDGAAAAAASSARKKTKKPSATTTKKKKSSRSSKERSGAAAAAGEEASGSVDCGDDNEDDNDDDDSAASWLRLTPDEEAYCAPFDDQLDEVWIDLDGGREAADDFYGELKGMQRVDHERRAKLAALQKRGVRNPTAEVGSV